MRSVTGMEEARVRQVDFQVQPCALGLCLAVGSPGC